MLWKDLVRNLDDSLYSFPSMDMCRLACTASILSSSLNLLIKTDGAGCTGAVISLFIP
jgi:hypothetical protein